MAASLESRSNGPETAELLEELLGVPFKVGGRDLEGIDCLGICLVCAERRGLPWKDPWKEARRRWLGGERDISKFAGFPDEWESLPSSEFGTCRRNDVAVYTIVPGETVPGHMGFALEDGLILSAREGAGVYAHKYSRLGNRVVQLWRLKEPAP